METIEYRTLDADKKHWGPGPWDDEPDKVQYEDPETGLPCLIVRNRQGALCGYVGVSPEHPYFKVEFQDVPDLDVHGGSLSYSNVCMENMPEDCGVCHIPGPEDSDEVWWLGFDTAHGFDYTPTFGKHGEVMHGVDNVPPVPAVTYKTIGYVKAEIASLAKQLVAVT